MCFSAKASFAAGGLLLVVGCAAQNLARRPAERFYASIPLLFALQQITEGVVWITFDGSPGLNAWATQLYSFFSHVLWPVYVPIAAWLLETDSRRRRLLAGVCAAGLAVGAYLLSTMIAYPIVARPTGGHVEYQAPHFYAAASMMLYLLATTLSLVLSTETGVRVFGVLALGSAVLAYAFFARWFISVWCFFAALLSISVLLRLMRGPAASGLVGAQHESASGG